MLSRLRRRVRGEDGLSLVETVVAIGLLSVVMMALLASSVYAVRATVDGRQNQQAGDYLNEAVEAVRSLDYGAVVMRTADLAGDPQLVTTGGVTRFDPGTGPEPVDASDVGAVTPHVEARNTDNGVYTVRRYVTVPAGTATNAQGIPAVRRLTVQVSWETRSGTRRRTVSTLVTNTRRGLPLPYFRLAYNGPASVVAGVPTQYRNPATDVDFGFALTNLGARDAWTISASTSGWSYYVDTDKDGLWSGDIATEPALSGASTGLIEAGSQAFYLVARRSVGGSESGTTQTTFTATSEAIPTAPTKSIVTALVVVDGVVVGPTPTTSASPSASPSGPAVVCTPGSVVSVTDSGAVPGASTNGGHTLTALHALNGDVVGDTTTLATTTLATGTTALQPAPCNFSTDAGSGTGRHLAAGGTGSAGTQELQFQPASASQDAFRGTAVMVLYVLCDAGTPTLTVTLRTLSGSTYGSVQATGTQTPTCNGSTFSRVDVPLAISGNGFTLGSLSQRLVVRTTSTVPVRLLYGVTAAPSRLVVGLK